MPYQDLAKSIANYLQCCSLYRIQATNRCYNEHLTAIEVITVYLWSHRAVLRYFWDKDLVQASFGLWSNYCGKPDSYFWIFLPKANLCRYSFFGGFLQSKVVIYVGNWVSDDQGSILKEDLLPWTIGLRLVAWEIGGFQTSRSSTRFFHTLSHCNHQCSFPWAHRGLECLRSL